MTSPMLAGTAATPPVIHPRPVGSERPAAVHHAVHGRIVQAGDQIVLPAGDGIIPVPQLRLDEVDVVDGQHPEPVPDSVPGDPLFLHHNLFCPAHGADGLLDAPGEGLVFEDVQMELFQDRFQVIPIVSRYTDRRNGYYTYACKACTAEPTPITKTPKEPALIPGSYASAEAVAQIVVQKFVMGVPLYRQEQAWERQNVLLSRQTMSNWLLRCTEDWLSPVYEELHKRLLEHDLLHADETELQVLHEEGKTPQSKSYMWLYRTGGNAERPIVLYDYRPSRGQEHPKRFLNGFHGYLQTDGYPGYNGVEDVIHVGCWAHARRKFEEARQAVPKGEQPTTAEQGVAYCTKLFQLEERFKDLPPEERKRKRLEEEQPILDALSAWARSRAAAPKSKLGIALNYLLNQWDSLTAYLLDGRIELSNNRAERSIKPFVISRKNFLFANTPSGARSSAVLFSLIETAKENGLDPYRYLVWLLREAPKRFTTDKSWAASLLPQFAPPICKRNS